MVGAVIVIPMYQQNRTRIYNKANNFKIDLLLCDIALLSASRWCEIESTVIDIVGYIHATETLQEHIP